MPHQRMALYLILIALLGGWVGFKAFHKQVWKKISTPPANYAVPANNPSTKEGIKLGKKLFFDPTLSKNHQVSCATCHRPEVAFTDAPNPLSRGGDAQIKLLRNTPSILNIAYAPTLFWDGGATDLESQVFAPLLHPAEIQQNLKQLEITLNEDSTYKTLFYDAFQIKTITTEYLAKAIAQYERSLMSNNSKYDQYKRNERTLTDKELRGYIIFDTYCSSCHKGEQLSDFDFHNNGLDRFFDNTSQEEIHRGRYRITRNPEDLGKYKTPSLKNVAITPPYMHDGRLADLNAVINHYAKNIQKSEYLDKKLKGIKQNGFGFTAQEKLDLLAFLLTLTDTTFKHEKWENESCFD